MWGVLGISVVLCVIMTYVMLVESIRHLIPITGTLLYVSAFKALLIVFKDCGRCLIRLKLVELFDFKKKIDAVLLVVATLNDRDELSVRTTLAEYGSFMGIALEYVSGRVDRRGKV